MFDLDSLVDDYLTSRYEDQHGDPDLDEDTSDYLEDFDLSEYGIDYRHNDPFYSPDPSDMD